MKDTKLLKDPKPFDESEYHQHQVNRRESSITSQLAEIKNRLINLADTEPFDDTNLSLLSTIHALLDNIIFNIDPGEAAPLPHQTEEEKRVIPSPRVLPDASGVIRHQETVPPGNRRIKCPYCHKFFFVDSET